MPATYLPSWCRIHLDRVADNLDRALALVPPGRDFCAVLKADAYGHGIDRVVPVIRDRGVRFAGITSNAEAQAAREAGFTGRLIRLRTAPPDEITDAVDLRIEELAASEDTARLCRTLQDAGQMKTPVHLTLNSGDMARESVELGTQAGRDTMCAMLDRLGDRIGGICTHFASNAPEALSQASRRFQRDVDWVLGQSDLVRSDVLVHAGSSLTLVSDTPVETDMYRCGALLYGILKPDWGFRPTMDVEARVASLQDYPKGACVGYDNATRLARDSRLACVSIGYQNGFGRVAADRSAVLIQGQSAPVVGKISMNALIVDVTALTEVTVGDPVTVFGGHGASVIAPPTAERQFGTIMADLYTDWGLRNPRLYA